MDSDLVLLIRTHPAASVVGVACTVLVSILGFAVARVRPLWVATVAVSCALLPLSVGAYSAVRMLIDGFRAILITGSGGLATTALILGEVRTISLVGAVWGAVAACAGSIALSIRIRRDEAREPGTDTPLSPLGKAAGWIAVAASILLPLLAIQDARVSALVTSTLWGTDSAGTGSAGLAAIAAQIGRELIILTLMTYLGIALSFAILVLSWVGVRQQASSASLGIFRRASLVLTGLCLSCVLSVAVSASNRSAFQARAMEAVTAPVQVAPARPTPAVVGPGIEPPVVVSRVEAEYPEEARRAGATGTIRVRFVVTAAGDVENVRIERGGNQDLEIAAIAAVSQWRYRPAIRAGQPVSVELTAEIRFPR